MAEKAEKKPEGAADRCLDVVGGLAVVRPGEAVGQQGALERDDGLAGGQRVGDVGGEHQLGGDGAAGDRAAGNRGRGLHAAIMEVDDRRARREAP